jgi:hypothetical protein
MTIPCDSFDASGNALISGTVTRRQTKTLPSCTFPEVTTADPIVAKTCEWAKPFVPTCSNPIATMSSGCTRTIDGSCVNGQTTADCSIPVVPVYTNQWSDWIATADSNCYSGSITLNRYCPVVGTCEPDEYNLATTRTQAITSDQCPTVVLTATYNGKQIPNVQPNIPYNAMVKVGWNSSSVISCLGTYSDLKQGTVTISSETDRAPTQTSSLKRDTTYRVDCKGMYDLPTFDEVKVLIDRISPGYIEQ